MNLTAIDVAGFLFWGIRTADIGMTYIIQL